MSNNRVPGYRPTNLVEPVEERQQQDVSRCLGHRSMKRVVARFIFLPVGGFRRAIAAQLDLGQRALGRVDGSLLRKCRFERQPCPHHLQRGYPFRDFGQTVCRFGCQKGPFPDMSPNATLPFQLVKPSTQPRTGQSEADDQFALGRQSVPGTVVAFGNEDPERKKRILRFSRFRSFEQGMIHGLVDQLSLLINHIRINMKLAIDLPEFFGRRQVRNILLVPQSLERNNPEASMNSFAIERPPVVALPVVESEALFPVRRVYCIGRNYAAHAVEMGHDPEREDPFFFQKNPENLDFSGEFPYPPKSSNVHHEAELAVLLKSGGSGIAASEALDHVFGYAISLDMTRRDLQGEQKKLGRPWEIGKAFERSAPIGPVHPVSKVGHPTEGRISLKSNGTLRQDGNLAQMIWKIPEMISYLSEYFQMAGGDVILTGTPAGVGKVDKGDLLEVAIESLGELRVKVV